jgi:hypothetical protein
MANIIIKEIILAVVTVNKNQPASGVPVFYAEDEKERDKIAFCICKALAAVSHDLGNGSCIIVKH